MTNLSAEALAESRSMSRLKVQAFQRLNNRGHCHALRLASHVEGRYEDAANYDLQIIWDDVEARSMSQMADALGKIATQLRVPAEKLWELIPGVTRATVQEWQATLRRTPTRIPCSPEQSGISIWNCLRMRSPKNTRGP